MKPTVIIISLLLSSCTSRLELARDIAGHSNMKEERIYSQPFNLTVFKKTGKNDGAANVYIEGDGLAWQNRFTPSLDPTPTNPLGLRLAAEDDVASNVIYIARPCQYEENLGLKPCRGAEYWTGKRFAPEVVDSINNALNEIKNQNNISDLNLIGYSGGGAIAVLIAAERQDVKGIRTVAGNLDHELFNRVHNVSKMDGSLNATDVAAKVSNIPQMHFIGEDDQIVPEEIYKSFKRASGDSNCVRSYRVKEATHENGWARKWKELLRAPLSCTN